MYQAVGSRGSRVSRVLWMLEELEEPYEFVEVKLRSPRAYELNPSGKVPILIDGDVKITDSAAICVYHPFVAIAADALKGTGIHVAAVSTAFPHGLAPLKTRLAEIDASVKDGADEIDVVIPRGLVYEAKWQELYDEIVAMRAACGEAHLKVILGTGDLATLRNIMLASMVSMMAGADFIKTSTGKESVNAVLPVGLVMVRAIRAYFEQTGYLIGFKPAGGISTAKGSLDWLVLMKEELGRQWLEPELFRFGASSLLTDIERQLEHHLTGHYSANHRHAMA